MADSSRNLSWKWLGGILVGLCFTLLGVIHAQDTHRISAVEEGATLNVSAINDLTKNIAQLTEIVRAQGSVLEDVRLNGSPITRERLTRLEERAGVSRK